ncbi:MAG: hypothetical protein UHD09_01025 [Bifidobacterium sp.]|nr:hypothetical protein [Bifidobacterium sp.]
MTARHLVLDDHGRVDAVARAGIGVRVVDDDGAHLRGGERGRRVVRAHARGVGAGDDGAVRVEEVDLVAQHVLDVRHDHRGRALVDLHGPRPFPLVVSYATSVLVPVP